MTDAEKWAAVRANDEHCDGLFFYAVSTTGIYCRPSCRSKQPLRAHVTFFDDALSAQIAGYRPCKRCRPDMCDQATTAFSDIAPTLICAGGRELSGALRAKGYSPRTLNLRIKRQTGMTLYQYASHLKIEHAMKGLRETDLPILQIAQTLGYNSPSSFYRAFSKIAGTSPAAYRHKQGS